MIEAEPIVELAECKRCKQAIRVYRTQGREVAFDEIDGSPHRCWSTEIAGDLLILED